MNNDTNQNNSFIIPSMEDNNTNNNNQSTYQAPIYQETPIQEDVVENNIVENSTTSTTFEELKQADEVVNTLDNDINIETPVLENNTFIEETNNDTSNDTIQAPIESTKSFIPDFISNDNNKNTVSSSSTSVKSQSTVSSLMTNNSTNLYQSGPKVYAVEKQKVNIPVAILITGIVLLAVGYLVYMFMNGMTRKMVCESNVGTITISYNKDAIIGYKSDKITYDIYEQRTYADEVGIKQYLNEFEEWFKSTTNGSCKR